MRLNTIEYIGAAPKKPKKANPLGGWLMIVLALVIGGFIVRPLLPFLTAQQDLTTGDNLSEAITDLEEAGDFGSKLAASALKRTKAKVVYYPTYYKIDFPNGDIAENKGVCTDVIIRSYRAHDIDLQELVHEDMKWNFRQYPQIWQLQKPDTNIDHRRVPNLQRFFSRKDGSLPISKKAEDYQPGDIVAWRLLDGATHIGMVVPGPGSRKDERWIVHNIGSGPKWEDCIFSYEVLGHYRYHGPKKENAVAMPAAQ